jgi:hypothetical protein
LHRRHTQVGEGAGDVLDAAPVEDAVEIAVIGVHELDPIAKRRERVGREGKGIGIAVEAEDARCAVFEERPAVSAKAHGAVDEETTARWIELRERLSHEHRCV